MTIVLPITTIKQSLEDAVDALIGQMGETIIYNFHDGSPSVTIRAVRQKLREEELAGDYEQGDCRFTLNFKDMPKPPEKYDTILGADGVLYRLVDYIAVDKGIDNQVLVYRPVGRG